MPREFSRTSRVGDFIKQELASLIQLELRDPRIGMVSVTGVEVSRDFSHATVFVTVLGKESAADAEESITALNHAAGFLRSKIAKVNNARTTPKLRFVFDVSIVRGARMSKMIDDAVAVDREHAAGRGDDDVGTNAADTDGLGTDTTDADTGADSADKE